MDLDIEMGDVADPMQDISAREPELSQDEDILVCMPWHRAGLYMSMPAWLTFLSHFSNQMSLRNRAK